MTESGPWGKSVELGVLDLTVPFLPSQSDLTHRRHPDHTITLHTTNGPYDQISYRAIAITYTIFPYTAEVLRLVARRRVLALGALVERLAVRAREGQAAGRLLLLRALEEGLEVLWVREQLARHLEIELGVKVLVELGVSRSSVGLKLEVGSKFVNSRC